MKARGSRAQVMHGTAKRTSGGLTKKQLKYNKQGKIVSKRMSARAKKDKRLVKAGYKTKKGTFGSFKNGKRVSGRRSKRRSRRKSRKKSKRKQRGGAWLDAQEQLGNNPPTPTPDMLGDHRPSPASAATDPAADGRARRRQRAAAGRAPRPPSPLRRYRRSGPDVAQAPRPPSPLRRYRRSGPDVAQARHRGAEKSSKKSPKKSPKKSGSKKTGVAAPKKKVEEVKEVSYENLARGPINPHIMTRYGIGPYDY